MTAYLLTRRMGADLREKMEEHYKTFIVGIPVIVACGPADARLSRTLPRSLGRVSTGSGELTTAATTWVLTDPKNSHWILGDRDPARGAIPRGRVVGVSRSGL